MISSESLLRVPFPLGFLHFLELAVIPTKKIGSDKISNFREGQTTEVSQRYDFELRQLQTGNKAFKYSGYNTEDAECFSKPILFQ